MVLGDSPIPLEEDIIKKKLDYIKTWSEWTSDTYETIFKYATTSFVATQTIYTVPKNKVLYILNVYLNAAVKPNNNVQSTCSFKINSQVLLYMNVISGNGNVEYYSNSLSYDLQRPIKVDSGGIIALTGASASNCSAGFYGFLVDKSLI